LIVTAHVPAVVEEHPVHPDKLFLPEAAGVVRVTVVPAAKVRVKLVVPLLAPLLSVGVTVIATPLDGLVELTESV